MMEPNSLRWFSIGPYFATNIWNHVNFIKKLDYNWQTTTQGNRVKNKVHVLKIINTKLNIGLGNPISVWQFPNLQHTLLQNGGK